MPIAGRAEEDVGAGDRGWQAAVRAGWLYVMPQVKARRCCQRVCGFRYADDMLL